jgi:excisionase family DNA binding protein
MTDPGDAARAALGGLLELPAMLARIEALNRELLQRVALLEARLPRELLPTPEYCRRVGLSRSSVARGIKSGVIPVVRIGRRVLIDASAIRPTTPEDIARRAREVRGG